MNAESTPPAKAAAPPHASLWAVVPAALALVLIVVLWLVTSRQMNGMEATLAKRLSDFEQRMMETRAAASHAQETTRELAAKVAVLEQKLAESQNQQLALEALYTELARGRDETTLAEIEKLVFTANQQLVLTGNVKAALLALEAADGRLARLSKPRFTALRHAFARDMERLRAAPLVDVPGLAARLDEIIARVDELPLIPTRPARTTRAAPSSRAESPSWRRVLDEVVADLSGLIRIENIGRAELPLIAPEQAYFLRENLRLRLLAARIALIARDEAAYRRDLEAARAWVERYFDARDGLVKSTRAALAQLSASPLRVDVPDISASVEAVRNFKLVSERSGR